LAKKQKVVKRLYESGREITFSSSKKKKAVVLRKKKLAKTSKLLKVPTAIKRPKAIVYKEPFIDSYDLPLSYGETYLSLMSKDPKWIYAYWEINPEDLVTLKDRISDQDIGTSCAVLRIYDVTLIDFNGSNAHSYFDIDVGKLSGNWYINIWADDISYLGEIGLRAPNGEFFPLGKSNSVHVPRKAYSGRSEQIWMKVADDAPQEAYVVASSERSQGPAQDAKPQPQIPYHINYNQSTKKRRNIYITDDDIRRYYSVLSPLLKDIISSNLSRYYGRKTKKVILEGESEWERQDLLSRFPDHYFVKTIALGASDQMVILGQADNQAGSLGASENIPSKKRDFFFELNTEVIVYGRTEPDAEVWLGEKKVDLNSDGTFSMRFALPDGKVPLEFKAISNDKIETREIATYVDRYTCYRNYIKE